MTTINNNYRIIERHGFFYPQRKFLFFWIGIRFSGEAPSGELSSADEPSCFSNISDAEYLINQRIKLSLPSSKKIHIIYN